MKRIKEILRENGIEYCGAIPFDECRVINRPLLERRGAEDAKTAIMLLAPYFSGDHPERNVSLYAVPRDYHLFFTELFEKVVPILEEEYKGHFFIGFSDNSPISEVPAAAKAGLGVIGENHLLINEKYGSFVFIGEILTDLVFDEASPREISPCLSCGKCTTACPSKDECLSKLTQTKGEKDEHTKKLIKDTGIAWGCDICQEVCPYNASPETTPLDFFKKDLTDRLSTDMISEMSETEFSERAYAWKGKKTILSNLSELEKL